MIAKGHFGHYSEHSKTHHESWQIGSLSPISDSLILVFSAPCPAAERFLFRWRKDIFFVYELVWNCDKLDTSSLILYQLYSNSINNPKRKKFFSYSRLTSAKKYKQTRKSRSCVGHWPPCLLKQLVCHRTCVEDPGPAFVKMPTVCQPNGGKFADFYRKTKASFLTRIPFSISSFSTG